MVKRIGRKRHSSSFKAQVAFEACKGNKTIAEIAAARGVHPSQVAAWKNVSARRSAPGQR
jgi:transposase